MANKGPFEVGFGKPPRSTRFKPGQSGNPNGRPRGAKSFAVAIEQELVTRVTVTENGRRRRISKREVIAKHLVNKAASGDLKAIPLLLNEARALQGNLADAGPDQVRPGVGRGQRGLRGGRRPGRQARRAHSLLGQHAGDVRRGLENLGDSGQC